MNYDIWLWGVCFQRHCPRGQRRVRRVTGRGPTLSGRRSRRQAEAPSSRLRQRRPTCRTAASCHEDLPTFCRLSLRLGDKMSRMDLVESGGPTCFLLSIHGWTHRGLADRLARPSRRDGGVVWKSIEHTTVSRRRRQDSRYSRRHPRSNRDRRRRRTHFYVDGCPGTARGHPREWSRRPDKLPADKAGHFGLPRPLRCASMLVLGPNHVSIILHVRPLSGSLVI